MHGMLMMCRCPGGMQEGSDEEAQPKAIVGAIEAYEAARCPDGKTPGGEGSIRE
jgi:hypothetical protein